MNKCSTKPSSSSKHNFPFFFFLFEKEGILHYSMHRELQQQLHLNGLLEFGGHSMPK